MKHEDALVMVRIGVGIVFLLFGIDKAVHPESWAGWIPPGLSRILPLPASLFLLIQGIAEAMLGISLLAGFATRISAGAAAGMLAAIIVVIGASGGLSDITVRDFGLLMAAIAVMLAPPRKWSIDRHLQGKR